MKPSPPKDIDSYIATFPPEMEKVLHRIRRTMKKAVPEATEAIRYQIPTFRINGKNLIHFAGFAKHVAVYPAPRGVADFEEELTAYMGGKGTVHFPLDKPVDYDLIARIAKVRLSKIT